MRMIQAHPDEERTMRVLAEPRHSMVHDHHRPTLYTVVAVLAASATVKPRIVCDKASLEARHRRTLRVEDLRADKRCRAISTLVQDVRKIWNIFGQRSSQIIQVIELRISAREYRGMGRCRQGYLRIGTGENHALAGQAIEVCGESCL